MKLDLRRDHQSLLKYFKQRVRQHLVYVNAGPGKDEDSITQMTLGYQFDQAGWVALVFDTRPKAAVDGQWQSYIEENEHELPHWCKVYKDICESKNAVALIHPDGKRESLDSDSDLANVLGEFLRDLLTASQADGLFDKLPCANHCRMTVEEHEGQFGWSDPPDGAAEENQEEGRDPFAVSEELKLQTAKLAKSKQIAFWIDRLRDIAANTKLDPEDFDFDVFGNCDALAEIGRDAVVPMLQLAVDLAGKPQFRDDADEAVEFYRSWVLEQMIHKVDDLEHATPEVETLLLKVVAKAIKANVGRQRLGAAAFFAAQALFNLFDDYPCPELGDHNELVDPAPFLITKKMTTKKKMVGKKMARRKK